MDVLPNSDIFPHFHPTFYALILARFLKETAIFSSTLNTLFTMRHISRSSKTLLYVSLVSFGLYSCNTTEENPDSEQKSAEEQVDPIEKNGEVYVLKTGAQFEKVISEVSKSEDALFVFDIDNTLLITNDNKFGSDWWYSQTKENSALKLNVDGGCLFDQLTPMFYAMFDTKPVFPEQPKSMEALETESNKVIGCTSRGYAPSVATSTILELQENTFDFMRGDSMWISENVVMSNDVIYTKGNNKGDALLGYLAVHPYTNIYYFDDSFFKVENVRDAFKVANKPVTLYHMEIAPKIPYTAAEMSYMESKLCNVIETMNRVDQTSCNCQNP